MTLNRVSLSAKTKLELRGELRSSCTAASPYSNKEEIKAFRSHIWPGPFSKEKATLELAARTEMPSGEDEAFQSVVGLESHTTRHFPSRTMGSVSF
ncbi:hypothetical protein EYF80_018684 [Liparis tanakae]|uniref:Uncharacterized protein n=1 Tax=Liparis tanakae TaxID=230148 RepID=A0A4Z2I1K6_9TELE|nr:hypothetical protein EYF80_018684 [Liparis tanakae]